MAPSENHIQLKELTYARQVRAFLADRYGPEAARDIWLRVEQRYAGWLPELPVTGGKKGGHARAVYGGLLVFALCDSLPDRPPIGELQGFVQEMFMAPFAKLGRIIDLNRPLDMRLIGRVFQRSGNRDRREIQRWPGGFVNIGAPYDARHRASRYCFTQCPNAAFASAHGLLHVLPLMCNCDFYGISQIHGRLIRRGTCGNSDRCDYLVVGDRSPVAEEYDTVADGQGFLVSRKKHGTEAKA